MKIGVFNPVLQDRNFEDACKFLADKGVQAIEIGCGGYPGKHHCDTKLLLNNEEKFNEFKSILKRNNLIISGFSCHGNPVHPNKDIAKKFDDDFNNAILLCEKMGISILKCFSGCPGDSETSQRPSWVTCPWPEDFQEVLEYQWNDVLIPYWKEKVEFANKHGVNKIAIEMHPGFCVYNPSSLLKLREAVGTEIGANFDPSHLIWQGIDPVKAIRELGKHNAIYHFHAKDTKIDTINCPINGVLDVGHYGNEINRSWIFRSVGYGHDIGYWKDIISALRLVGYNHVLSIEHEDSLMTTEEGLCKAIEALKQAVIFEEKGQMYWA